MRKAIKLRCNKEELHKRRYSVCIARKTQYDKNVSSSQLDLFKAVSVRITDTYFGAVNKFEVYMGKKKILKHLAQHGGEKQSFTMHIA